MENVIQPNMDWYTRTSRELGVPVRCPFASVHRCPRYYQSVSLLGHFGNTAIPEKENAALLERWRRSDLWPVVDEQATSIMGEGDTATMFSNFCPEVAYDSYGLFADFFSRVGDELDRDLRHKRLAREGVASTDYRWNWTTASPLHYTACSIYSPLMHNQSGQTAKVVETTGSWLTRIKKTRMMKWLAIGGTVLAGAAKWSDSLRKLWEAWRNR